MTTAASTEGLLREFAPAGLVTRSSRPTNSADNLRGLDRDLRLVPVRAAVRPSERPAYTGGPDLSHEGAGMGAEYLDWMGDCYDQLRDLPLCRIPLPGSHDAGSYGGINAKSKTQEFNAWDQLAHGFRYFDFRVRVDNGVFFSHHGADESRDNGYAQWPTETTDDNGIVFSLITQYCDQHPREVVVLNFTDFSAVWNQSFTDDDKKHFMDCIKRRFGDRLILRSRDFNGNLTNTIPTYGACIPQDPGARGRQVLVLVNEDVPVWAGHEHIWLAKDCWADRFSDYSYSLHSWQTLLDDTLSDQQDYLATRDLDRFWVSQTILGYGATTSDGHSQNYYGAQKLNPFFSTAYPHWWAGESAIPGKTQAVRTPNVLLLDYSGVFDDFAGVCKALLQGTPVPPS